MRLYATSCVVKPTDLFTIHMQAQWLHVPVYIAGFVIGTASLCMTVLSPIIGYFVSTRAVVELSAALLYQSQIFHNFTPQLPHLGLKFTQLAGLFLAGGSLILFGY